MSMSKATGIQKIVSNGYCIGCGVCVAIKDSPYSIQLDQKGKYQVIIRENSVDIELPLSVCPFSDHALNEDEIGTKLFGNYLEVQQNNYLGYFLKCFAGFVSEDTYREKGSSGGFGSWLAVSLLEEHLVDYVIHIRPDKQSSTLFVYSISSTREEICEGAKSKYYPVELSKVLNVVRNTPGKYILIGVPCFIKAIRLLSDHEQVFKERIIFTFGLVCGHQKTDRFAKAIGWELGIQPDKLESIDFRVKISGENASSYGVSVKEKGNEKVIIFPMKNILVHNWGHGLFRYNACDYCDDVMAETADVTIGDAWLSEYVKDDRGTNIVVVRNPIILYLLEKRYKSLSIEEITADKVYESQAGGFRNRREGLSYRLYLKDRQKEWRPTKRVASSADIPNKRKKIYQKRIPLLHQANDAYEKALLVNEFSVFKKLIEPALRDYNKLYDESLVIKILKKKIKRFIKLLTKRRQYT